MQRYIEQDPLDPTVKADGVFTKSLMSVTVALVMCKQTEEVGQGMSAAWCASGQRRCPDRLQHFSSAGQIRWQF